jgi:hypothetical protein
MQMQFNAFGEQTKSLGEAFTKAATDAVCRERGPAYFNSVIRRLHVKDFGRFDPAVELC